MLKKLTDCPLIFSLELPVEGSEHSNCYFVISEGEMLVIDPPLYKPGFLAMYDEAMNELEGKVHKISVFLTHTHGELARKAPRMPDVNGSIYMTRDEYEELASHSLRSYKKTRFKREGFPKEALARLFPQKSGKESGREYQAVFVEEGTLIQIGSLIFQCMLTPGPSKGHCCLLLQKKGFLFAGVLLPAEGLPDADIWNDKVSSLDKLLESLEKLRRLPAMTVFPARGDVFSDCAGRAETISAQYYMRLIELYQLVHDCPGENAYELSRKFGHRRRRAEGAAAGNQWSAMKATLACLIMLRNNRYVAVARKEKNVCNYPGTARFADLVSDSRMREHMKLSNL